MRIEVTRDSGARISQECIESWLKDRFDLAHQSNVNLTPMFLSLYLHFNNLTSVHLLTTCYSLAIEH